MTTKDDLWPDNVLDPSTDLEPREILIEQAAKLGEKTRKRVVASVRSSDTTEGGKRISMVLTNPTLPDYEYVLIFIEQPARWYPCRLTHEGVTWVAETEAGFRQYLESCLKSTATRKIIGSVAAMAR